MLNVCRRTIQHSVISKIKHLFVSIQCNTAQQQKSHFWPYWLYISVSGASQNNAKYWKNYKNKTFFFFYRLFTYRLLKRVHIERFSLLLLKSKAVHLNILYVFWNKCIHNDIVTNSLGQYFSHFNASECCIVTLVQ